MSRMAERAKRSDVFPGKHSDSDVLHDASFPGNLESLQHSQRGGFSSHEAYSVPKTRERRDYSGSVYNDASFSSSFPKGNFETRRSLGSMEVVNSNRKSPGYRTKMRSVEHRNSEDSHGTIPEASSRSSSSSQKSKKNEIFREDVSQRDKTPHSDPPHGKGDGKNRKQSIDRRNHAKQENTNTSRSMPDELEVSLEVEITVEFQLLLQANNIQVLKKNKRISRTSFLCTLCDFNLETKPDCIKHIKDNRHCSRKKLNDLAVSLRDISEPAEDQITALTIAVEKVYEEHGINKNEREQRADVTFRLEKILKEKIPDVEMFMYGSSLTGFGLKTADINISMTSTDKDKKPVSLFKQVYMQLKDRKGSDYSDVRFSYTSKMPNLLLTDNSTGYTVSIAVQCYNAHCTSELLSIYSDFDDRVRKLVVAFRYWTHLCGLDRHVDGFMPPQAFNIMVIYFLQVLKPPAIPLITPPKVTGDEFGDYKKDSSAFEKMRAKVMKVNSESHNSMSVGELWFNLLKFYCLKFDTANTVVCIRNSQKLTRNAKPWNNKKLAVEDPYILKKNITSMISNPCVHEYWLTCLYKAFQYFGYPRNKEGRLYTPFEDLRRRIKPTEDSKASHLTKVQDKEQHGETSEDTSTESFSDIESDESTKVLAGVKGSIGTSEKQCDALSVSTQRNYYEFSKESLTEGKGPIMMCTSCEKEGHLKNACPEDELPEILPLPQLSPSHTEVLSQTLNRLPSAFGLSAKSLDERMEFMKYLEEFIQVLYKDASLTLFGSSCNGFGFEKSDMDISLTFSETKHKTDKPFLIEAIARRLTLCEKLIKVQPILTAKVPIIKFTVKMTGLEGDISLDNILAQQNTKLLHFYTQIDPRVSVLGYTIKNFTRVCDIGDASRGSLSSYAFVLMMLYYLQQVSPPVVPVLQELYEGREKPELIIEGCDAWFMDDLSKLDKLWLDKGKNKMSVAELWLGFLRFYVEEFNLMENVISIRQKEPLSRFEKLWSGTCIAVEDPFDLNHNLGSGLTRKMNNFIIKTFINGRMLYGSPIDDNMEMFNKYSDPYDYFFDKELLSECRPPNVRGCRHCGKIGHIASHCPVARKEKEEKKRLQQQQRQQQQVKQHQQEAQQQSKQQQHQKLQEAPSSQKQQEIRPLMQQSSQHGRHHLVEPSQQHHPQQHHERQQHQRPLLQHPPQSQQHPQQQQRQFTTNQHQQQHHVPPLLQQHQQQHHDRQQQHRPSSMQNYPQQQQHKQSSLQQHPQQQHKQSSMQNYPQQKHQQSPLQQHTQQQLGQSQMQNHPQQLHQQSPLQQHPQQQHRQSPVQSYPQQQHQQSPLQQHPQQQLGQSQMQNHPQQLHQQSPLQQDPQQQQSQYHLQDQHYRPHHHRQGLLQHQSQQQQYESRQSVIQSPPPSQPQQHHLQQQHERNHQSQSPLQHQQQTHLHQQPQQFQQQTNDRQGQDQRQNTPAVTSTNRNSFTAPMLPGLPFTNFQAHPPPASELYHLMYQNMMYYGMQQYLDARNMAQNLMRPPPPFALPFPPPFPHQGYGVAGLNYGLPPAGFLFPRLPPGMPSGGDMPIHGNTDQMGQPPHSDSQHSGHDSEGNSAGSQSLNPEVQKMFDSVKSQVFDTSSQR